MHDRVKAAAVLKEKVGSDKIVEGWVEGPCCMAANLRGINTLMLDFYDDPTFVEDLLAFVTEVAIAFGRAQREAGIDLMGVGDAPASLIGRPLFENVIAPWHAKLVAALRGMGLRTRSHICGNTSKICEARAKIGYDILDIDSQVAAEFARLKMGPEAIILGNVPTVAVMEKGTSEDVGRVASDCHRALGDRFILSAGCEVPRSTPIANMDALCDYARSRG